ncbi:hypothetical protein Taro_016178 [Colocasia esculenta]|uniref:Uncharacterized protein n=1 Tax=Colocasia esculenta TaxID=4460 RepID=A0A843UJL0_COLES|nr:hypothetical protein [Colocasia esculenta]
MASSMTATVVTSPVGCPRFFVSLAVSSGLCPGTCVVPSRSVSSDLDTLTLVFELHVRLRERRQWDSDTLPHSREFRARIFRDARHGPVTVWSAGGGVWLVSTVVWLFHVERQLDLSSVTARLRVVFRSRQTFPTEPVTREAHPYPHSCTSGYAPGSCSSFKFLWKFGYVNCEIYIKCGVFLCVYTDCGLVSLARLRPVRGRRTRIKYVIGLTGLAEVFRHSWYQSKKSLKWLIDEIGVVEEMIRRKSPSV